MIAVIDYGAGNLFSVKNALEYLKQPYVITNDIDQIRKADGYILPGVGAFPFAMKQLTATGLVEELKEQVKQKPLLGICLGMQMLFEESTEFELTQGLGLIPGRVDHLVAPDRRSPIWAGTNWRSNSRKIHCCRECILKTAFTLYIPIWPLRQRNTSPLGATTAVYRCLP